MSVAGQRYFWGPAWQEYYFQFWNRAEIINRIRGLAHQGKGIHLAAVAGEGEWHLIRAASYYFGSWRAAVKAAGFNYNQIRADIKWTRKKVTCTIRDLWGKKKDVSSRAVQLEEPALFAAAVRDRLFGSWEKAIQASGLDYEDIRKYQPWDEARLAKEVKRIDKAGIPLNAKSALEKRPLAYYAACRRYGCWGDALSHMGYDRNDVMLRRKWTKGEVIRDLKRLRREGVHMSDNNVRDLHPTLYAAACRLYGCWSKARERAGVRRFKRRHRNGTGYLAGFEPRAGSAAG